MYIAIDIGGTKTLIAAYSEDGDLLRSEKHPTEHNFDKFIHKLPTDVQQLAGDDQIAAITVAAPGLIDYETGIVKSFGNLEWSNVDIVGPLKHAITDQVFIDNDANLGALGEANLGAGQGYKTNLYITLSTGIGTGVTYDNVLSEAMRRSEGGMMKFRHDGKLVIWEKIASGQAFFKEYGKFGEDDNNPEHWSAWAEDVALGLTEMIALIQPNVVVIGGSMGEHIDKYHHFLQAAVQKNRGETVEMPIIVGAKHPSDAVINGCYVLCKQLSQA